VSEGVVAISDDRSLASFRPSSPLATTKKHASTKMSHIPSQIPSNQGIYVRGGAPANGLPKALAGAVIFATIERAVKLGLKAANIQYPAQLGGCILLFIVMCLTDIVDPSVASFVFNFLTPGAALLAKWFPVFFIPGLVMLPLSPPVGGTVDVSVNSKT
jgi:hypothetical protein